MARFIHRYSASPFSVVVLLFDILETALLIRVLLLFFAANAANPFVAAVYGLTDIFVAPFAGIFPATRVGGFLIEWSAFVAMIAYALLASLLYRLFSLILGSETETEITDIEEDEPGHHRHIRRNA